MKRGSRCPLATGDRMKRGSRCPLATDDRMKRGRRCPLATDDRMKRGSHCPPATDDQMKILKRKILKLNRSPQHLVFTVTGTDGAPVWNDLELNPEAGGGRESGGSRRGWEKGVIPPV